mmetsp:Transcript_6462/g.20933  ORF Transcript_6462/g.20933 Transcript_6462/m.20933 type:complete len:202 (+) Transcript_6462:1485-2090(+)
MPPLPLVPTMREDCVAATLEHGPLGRPSLTPSHRLADRFAAITPTLPALQLYTLYAPSEAPSTNSWLSRSTAAGTPSAVPLAQAERASRPGREKETTSGDEAAWKAPSGDSDSDVKGGPAAVAMGLKVTTPPSSSAGRCSRARRPSSLGAVPTLAPDTRRVKVAEPFGLGDECRAAVGETAWMPSVSKGGGSASGERQVRE